jgi:hypothetical protein
MDTISYGEGSIGCPLIVIPRLIHNVERIANFFRASRQQKRRQKAACASLEFGGADGARTRDLRRDRPAF